MAVGTTADFKLTRDEIIELAFQWVGKLAEGEALEGEQLKVGQKVLNLIIRETDDGGKWLWTITDVVTVVLVANQFIYQSAHGVPTNISHLEMVTYRDSSARDHHVDILTVEGYESIEQKIASGEPESVYLTDVIDIALKKLFVHPMLSTVNTQDEVVGTDTNNYRCIQKHQADSTNQPITGANYLLYWEQGGSSGGVWATGTQYVAPELLRLTYHRPLFDFDLASDTSDLPISWPRALVLRLASDLGDIYKIPLDERAWVTSKGQAAIKDLKPRTIKKPTTLNNKAKYF